MRTSAISLLSLLLLTSAAALATVDADLLESRLESLRERPAQMSGPSCHDVFARLSAPGRIEISIVYGYNDQRPYLNVLDQQEKRTLSEGLQELCSDDLDRLCGFTAASEDELHKDTLDALGRAVHLTVKLVASSASDNDQTNRTTLKTEQAESSLRARAALTRALNESDVVFYVGHARNGGGPDFSPPRLNGQGTVDLKYYENHPEGLQLLRAGLAGSSNLKMLGMFSCLADRHFLSPLHQARPGLDLVLAGDITQPSVMDYALWGALHSVLGPTCASQFKANLQGAPAGFAPAVFTFHSGQ